MQLETARLIASYSQVEVNVHENYSGRGMYGDTTAAISSEEIMKAVTSAIVQMAEAGDTDAIAEVKKGISFCQDSLGYETIMY